MRRGLCASVLDARAGGQRGVGAAVGFGYKCTSCNSFGGIPGLAGKSEAAVRSAGLDERNNDEKDSVRRIGFDESKDQR